jgi:hypothetical protein
MNAFLSPTGKQLITKGRITEISPIVNSLNVSRLIRLMLDENNADFVPGRSIDVNILVQSFDTALSVPRNALRKEADTWLAFTLADGTVNSNVVTFIDWPGSSVIVESGLNSGDNVALDASIAAAAMAKEQTVRANKVEQ